MCTNRYYAIFPTCLEQALWDSILMLTMLYNPFIPSGFLLKDLKESKTTIRNSSFLIPNSILCFNNLPLHTNKYPIPRLLRNNPSTRKLSKSR